MSSNNLMNYLIVRKDIIMRIVEFKAEVVADSPLLISEGGKGRVKEVIKNVDGVPIIPGSSWKGMFRSAGEIIAKHKGIEVCPGLSDENCLSKSKKYNDLNEYLANMDIENAVKLVFHNTCLNCKIFGTQSIIGQTRFMDSLAKNYKLGTRPMIAINRKTGSVSSGALVTLEYVEPGSTFNFTLYTYNLPNYALGYLLEVMERINNHLFQIGGNKSRGFGFISFKNLTMTLKKGSWDSPVDSDIGVNISDKVRAEWIRLFEKYKASERGN
ncbi:type III CRISPR-associated RAMP protein Csx7 [Metallosphaera cuprina]|uniref:CRISPR-associated Csx7 family protein n=1 Tax=Metallosphaera cuprina (strain Ar-4) TaxID=1006006 RepID=F4G350_METCR|nr:CRISPR-associated RAMP protein Csx7 [Metallosphaera cuprina]AEB95248.1 CRISPR-associated Csx7 family protein [Metallosphaera cuprina Ar-4]